MQDAHSITPDQILDSLPPAIFTVDMELRITYCNRSAEEITALSRHEALGKLCSEVFSANLCSGSCPICLAMDSGRPCFDMAGIIHNHRQQQLKVRITASVLRDAHDAIIGGVATLQQRSLPIEVGASMQRAVQACEVQSIMAALRRNNNNRTAAARELGIHKSTFFRKIKKMGIDLPNVDGRFSSKPSCLD